MRAAFEAPMIAQDKPASGLVEPLALLVLLVGFLVLAECMHGCG